MVLSGLRHWMRQPGLRHHPLRTVLRAFEWKMLWRFDCERIGFNIGEYGTIVVPVTRRRGLPGVLFILRDSYEDHIRAVIEEFVRPGMQVMDIGANVGYWTVRMAHLVGSGGTVYAFEPSADNAANLRHGLALSRIEDRVVLQEIGLGDADSVQELFQPSDTGLTSLARVSDQDTRLEVEVRRLDGVWESSGRPGVGFVKIDVEGAEAMVLRGASQFLEECRPVVVCEFNDERLRALGSSSSKLLDEVVALGYTAYRLTHGSDRREPLTNPGSFEDVLLVPMPA